MLVDLVVDRFITGVPKRISREAPVLILRFESETISPGGGANAVANVRALDGVPLPVGVVGEDEAGSRLLAELERRGVTTRGVLVEPGYKTPTKTRILGGGRHSIKQQIVRYDVEDQLEPDQRMLGLLRSGIDRFAGEAAVAVLSDYGYGAVEPRLLPAVRANLQANSTVLCDSRYRLQDFAGLDSATPNEEEAEALLGVELGDDAARLLQGGQRLRATLAARHLLITRGSRGMCLFTEERAWNLPVYGTDQVADVTGAGDTVIGTFALATAAGASPEEAMVLANYAGGLVVMKMGTATLDRAELRHAIRTQSASLEEIPWARS